MKLISYVSHPVLHKHRTVHWPIFVITAVLATIIIQNSINRTNQITFAGILEYGTSIVDSTVPATYFGMHILGPTETNLNGSGKSTLWPSWNPSVFRLWNSYGNDPNLGYAYSGLSWKDLNPSNGKYYWYVFDKILAKYKAQGVTDLIYTVGYTPQWASGTTDYTKPPTNMAYLSAFITAVANRAIADGLPIKYWEIWNEPNNGANSNGDGFSGSINDMVVMAQTIYTAVKAVDPTYQVISPSPQGLASTPSTALLDSSKPNTSGTEGTRWMATFLNAGGGNYADIMAFHAYIWPPERIATMTDVYNSIYTTYNQSSKPVWNTESMNLSSTAGDTDQVRYFAVTHILGRAKGIDRYYWYTWDNDAGKEWDYQTGINAVGAANIQVRNWMLGATVGNISVVGTTYSVPITKNGQTNLAVWNSAGVASYETNTYMQYVDLQGATHAISGGAVPISTTPILLTTPVTSVNNPPTISITSPAVNATLSGTTTFSATATDDVGVTKVDFYEDTTLIATDTAPAYSVAIDTTALTNGTHTLKAIASDGTNSTPATITVSINNVTNTDAIAPTVTLSSPTSGTVARGTTLSLLANAVDNIAVAKVDFYVNSSLVCTDTATPYGCSWKVPTTLKKSYAFQAKATDTTGNSALSNIVTIKVGK